MKQRLWKKLNRGILLSVLLLAVLIVYVTADLVSFQAETKRIEQSVREYVEQSPQMAIFPSPYNKIGSPADESAIRLKMTENETFLRKYWSFESDSHGYNQGQIMLSQVQSVVEYNAKGLGMITSAKGIVQYVHSIRKTGFRTAEVSFTYTGSVKYMGDIQWVLFSANRQKEVGGVARGFLAQQEMKATPSGDVTAELVKVGDTWKIDSIEVSSVSVN